MGRGPRFDADVGTVLPHDYVEEMGSYGKTAIGKKVVSGVGIDERGQINARGGSPDAGGAQDDEKVL